LRPQWLGTTLQARATDEVISASPFAWGEALLRPAHAPRVARALFERAKRGDFSAVYAALELADPENPAHTAALEMATTAVGIAAACNVTVPSDLAADLFAEQEQLALLVPGAPPAPRIVHGELSEDEPLL